MKHGVYGQSLLYYGERGQRKTELALEKLPQQIDAATLMDLAYQASLRQIWVLPGSSLSNQLSEQEAVEAFWNCPGRNLWVNKHQSFGSGWLPNLHKVEIALPARDPRWPFQGISDPTVLFATVHYTEQALMTSLRWSPGHIGQELMRLTNQSKRATYIRPSQSDLTLFQKHKQLDLVWSRRLTKKEHGWHYLHVYDKNAMYLGAAASTSLGAGEYTHQKRPSFSPTLPGLWRIKITGISPFDGQELPHPTDEKEESWQYTPTVKLAMDLGYQVEILDGYFFIEHHLTLRHWYECLRNARKQFEHPDTFQNKEAATLALQLVKSIYTQSLGWLAHHPEGAAQTHQLYRPDWYFLVIATARERMFRIIDQVRCSTGQTPVAVKTDALYYASDNPNPQTAVPLVATAKGRTSFKHAGTYRLQDVEEALGADRYQFISRLGEVTKLEER